ncbi:VWA domain-containing protein [Streptomyces sp. KL116D]|uniref:vWA domain-containing protein n=1 Tax=Streptomyces sp. KL116D TaxID=3045152 RepID=UPI003556A1D8
MESDPELRRRAIELGFRVRFSGETGTSGQLNDYLRSRGITGPHAESRPDQGRRPRTWTTWSASSTGSATARPYRRKRSRRRRSERDAAAARGRNGPLAVCMLLLACAVLAAGGCSGGPDKVTLRVLAGPELADVRPLLKDLAHDTGVTLDIDYTATPDLTDRASYDLAWPASDRSFLLARQAARQGGARPESTTIMRSPVVVGVDADAARRLRARTGGGRRPGPTSPTPPPTARSASGCRTPGAATPAAPPSSASPPRRPAPASALRVQDVSCDRLRGFKSGQVMTGPTTADLIDAYVRRPDRADALIAHENELLALNAAGRLAHPLTIVRPEDGTVLSDFPLLLLDPARHDAYRKVVDWLLGADVQQRLMRTTWRRPAGQDLPRVRELRAPIGNALSYPDRRSVVDRLLADYGDPARGATSDHIVFLLDFSTSMRGTRIAALRSAFAGLSGADRTASGKFARFYRGERITVVRFGGTVLDERTVTVRGRRDLDALDSLVARGDFANATAVWSALDHGRAVAARSLAEDPGRPVAIVLMTDGASNAGISYAEFTARAAGQPRTPTYPVPIGEADTAALRRAALGHRRPHRRRRPVLLPLRRLQGDPWVSLTVRGGACGSGPRWPCGA